VGKDSECVCVCVWVCDPMAGTVATVKQTYLMIYVLRQLTRRGWFLRRAWEISETGQSTSVLIDTRSKWTNLTRKTFIPVACGRGNYNSCLLWFKIMTLVRDLIQERGRVSQIQLRSHEKKDKPHPTANLITTWQTNKNEIQVFRM